MTTSTMPAARREKFQFFMAVHLPDLLWPSAMSPTLRAAVDELIRRSRPGWNGIRENLGLWPADLARMQHIRVAHDDLADGPRVSLEAFALWLTPISQGVRNPPDTERLKALCHALVIALESMPAALLTEETQREGMRRWEFLPSAAEVMALFEPTLAQLERERDALGDLAHRWRSGLVPTTA